MKHPELGFHVVRFTQVPGEYKSSRDNRKGTEELYRANRWRVPLAIVRPQELLLFTGSYLLTGRFNPELELQRRPVEEVIALQTSLRQARQSGDVAQQAQLKQKIRAARSNALGTSEEWAGYAHSLRQFEEEAIERGYVNNLDSLQKVAQQTVSNSWMTLDDRGGLWLAARDSQSPKVGLSASTLMEGTSDAKAGYLLALSRVDAELRRKPKNRETLQFFREDWELLERLRAQVVPIVAGARHTEAGGGSSQ
jgi:hypothetical protein